jgi:hypothetical protein
MLLLADGIGTPILIPGASAFALPRDITVGTEWEIDTEPSLLTAGSRVDDIILGFRAHVPVEDRLVAESRGSFPDWLVQQYDLETKRYVTSVRVESDSYPVIMRMYPDMVAGATRSIAVADNKEIPITDMTTPCGTMEFDFFHEDGTSADSHVHQAYVWFSSSIDAGQGISMTPPDHWRNLTFRFSERGVFGAGKVEASAYPIQWTLNGTAMTDIADSKPFQINTVPLTETDLWVADFICTGTIQSLTLMPLKRQPIQGSTIRIPAGNPQMPDWMFTEYTSELPVVLRSATLNATAGVTLSTVADSSATTETNSLTAAKENVVSDVGPFSRLRFHFGADGHKVRDIQLNLEETIPIETNGIIIRQSGPETPWANKTLRFPATGSFGVIRVVAEDYTGLTVKLDDTTISGIDDSDDHKITTTTLDNLRDWPLIITHTSPIREVHLFSKEWTPFDGYRINVLRQQSPFTWLDKRFLAPILTAFSCGRIIGDSHAFPATLRLYAGWSSSYVTISVADTEPFRLAQYAKNYRWTFDAIPSSDGEISQVILATSMDGLGNG